MLDASQIDASKPPRVLGFIPARGGSKGVPGKNIKPLGGIPLLGYTIRAAKDSRCLDRIWVSTDDPAIAEVASRFEIEVSWLRPLQLATDEASIIDAVLHALDWFENCEGYNPEAVLVLQPTSPFRSVRTIREAVSLFQKYGDSVIAVTPVREHPYWCKRISNSGILEEFWPGMDVPAIRQSLPAAYRPSGSIYLSSVKTLRDRDSFYSECSRALIIADEEALDIDTPLDWKIAECLFRTKQSS